MKITEALYIFFSLGAIAAFGWFFVSYWCLAGRIVGLPSGAGSTSGL